MTHLESTRTESNDWPWSTVARRFLIERQARHWLQRIDPMLSLGEVRARVVGVRNETPDVKTFLLEPNGHWRGHRAGQHTLVEVTIDGVRHRRPFTIASPPEEDVLALTVKRISGGTVTSYLHEQLSMGDVVGLAQAAGDFVFPATRPERPLFITAGAGITPALAMLGQLAQEGSLNGSTLVHHARDTKSIIARDRLARWAEAGLELHLHTDDQPGPRGFDPDRFISEVPDFAQRHTFLCGPPPMMDVARPLYALCDAEERLHEERFVSPPPPVADGQAVTVTLKRSGRTVTLDGQGSLLEQLERAGEKPKHGCRMGICQTCRCTKAAGVTRDRETGALSTEPEGIRLCVSDARSDLELDL